MIIAGHKDDLTTLRAAADHDDPLLRAAALSGLLRVEHLLAEQLRAAFDDPSLVVRRRALELTARHSSGASLASEVASFLGGEAEQAELAAFVLGELEVADPAIVSALEQQALEHDDALARESAVAALGALHSGLATILAALGDKATVRRRAVIALAPFDGPEVEVALQAALEDRDWQVRQAAEDLLAPPPADEFSGEPSG